MHLTGEDVTRGRLARFRSAPTTFLEALLESEEELELIPSTSQDLTELFTSTSSFADGQNSNANYEYSCADSTLPLFDADETTLGMDFLRQSCLSSEFLGNISSGSGRFFSKLGIPSANVSSSSSVSLSPSGEWLREADASAKLIPQMNREQSGHSNRGLSSLEDLDIEKLLEGSVPCKVRAKRGCATHPRSIAERARRTRISDRMRKLQELVPKMDKQTKTVDMLDEAVKYIKFLQEQLQELMDHKKKCRCSNRDYWKT